MKKLLITLLCMLFSVSVFFVTASAEMPTVFVKDGASGNGMSPSQALPTLTEAFSALGNAGGRIVLCGKTTLDADLAPAPHTGTVTLTMVHNGTDYRTSGAELYFTGRHSLFLAGAVKFEDFTFHIAETAFILAQWNPLEMGEGIAVKQYKSGNGIYLVGGTQSGKEGDFAIRDGAPYLTVHSGTYHTITPYSRQVKATFTGDAVIDFYGGEVENLTGGPLNAGYLFADTEINIYGGRIKNLCFFTDSGYTSTALQGECTHTINVSGGEIERIYADANNASAVFALNYTNGAQQNLVSLLAGEGAGRVAVCKKEDVSKTEVRLQIGNMTGYVDGSARTLDAAPMIRFDRTMLPVRFVAESLGAEVLWDGATSTVTVTTEETAIEIVIGSAAAKVNGKAVMLDSPAFIENSRTYLPVRFVAENLDATVEWDGMTSTATLVAEVPKIVTPAVVITPLVKDNAAQVPLPEAPAGFTVIRKTDLEDKTTAGFVAQLVGMLSGYEFKKLPGGRCYVAMPDEWFELCNGPYAGNDKYMHHLDKLIKNKTTGIFETWMDDDFSVDVFNQYMLEEMYANYGTVSAKVISDSWLKYGIWDMGGGQRQAGAYGVISRRGYLPQFAGSGEFGNWYGYLSEPYIAADTLGMNAAGMPDVAVSLAGTFAVVTGDRDNVEWAKMFAAMFSMAYFESDIATLIRESAKVFPEGSFPMQLVDEVFALYKKYPDDWRTAYTEFENKYYFEDITNTANTTINCGFTLLTMLYGEGDFMQTAKIGSLAGYDCETTVGIALSVLGIIHGMDVMPETVNQLVWQNGRGVIVNLTRTSADEGIRMHADNLETRMLIADIVAKYVKNFESVLLEHGGYMDEKHYYIPVQTMGSSDSVVIENGNFETGTLDGFTVTGGKAEITPLATMGLHAAKLTGASDLHTTVQGLTVGKTYALTVYVNATSASAAYVYARAGGKTECLSVYHPASAANFEWQKSVKRVLVFEATAKDMEIGVRFVPGTSTEEQYAIVDAFVLTRIEETQVGTAEIQNKTADGIYKDALTLSVNTDAAKEVYIKLCFSNREEKNVDADITVNGKAYSAASFYTTGEAPADMTATDYVLIPVGVEKGVNTVSFAYNGKTLGITEAAVVCVTERW